MTGPGDISKENHDDLITRLMAICDRHNMPYQQRLLVGKTPYGFPFKVDLMLTGLPAYPQGLAVVGRWQEGSGSADQKLPFLLLCVARCRVNTVVVLDGEGWSDGVWDYMKRREGGHYCGVLTVGEFDELLQTAREAA